MDKGWTKTRVNMQKGWSKNGEKKDKTGVRMEKGMGYNEQGRSLDSG